MMTDEEVARVAHEVNRAYCASIGDTSQPAWVDAPDWQKASAIAGVKSHRDNPAMTPEMSHAAWFSHKLADGWVYGPEKDPVSKTHPCMRPYRELPVEQQTKDHLFRAVVHALS